MTREGRRVAIVGGGISGLATAFYLQRRGIRSTIFEESGRLGGLIQTDRVQGCELEGGPDSFLAAKTAVAELAAELGIADKLMSSNDKDRRVFVARNGRLLEMPRGMVMMVPSDWKAALQSPLFSLPAKWRMLREYRYQPRERAGDFSIRDLVMDHFGRETLEYLAEPLLSGVYGGNAAALSARSVLPKFVEYEAQYGSLIKGVKAARAVSDSGTVPVEAVENNRNDGGNLGTVPVSRGGGKSTAEALFLSFEGGMQTLIDALVEAVKRESTVVFAAVRSVRQGKDGHWAVEAGAERVEVDAVVLACPAHRSAQLLGGSELAGLLEQIPYCSSVLCTLLFERDQLRHALNGFGFLVPPAERRTIAAVTWINTKFPSRVAAGRVAIRAFLVDPEATRLGAAQDMRITKLVADDLQHWMRFKASALYSKVYRWPSSMPQYVVGHSERVDRVREEVRKCPGLYLSSNYLDGIGIPDCVRNAKVTAHSIVR